jgi:hypothetical protein
MEHSFDNLSSSTPQPGRGVGSTERQAEDSQMGESDYLIITKRTITFYDGMPMPSIIEKLPLVQLPDI